MSPTRNRVGDGVELSNMLAMLTAMRHKAMATSVLWGTMAPASLYTTRWKMQRKETLNISLFIRELNEQYKITKSAFHETSGIHNKVFNKYLNVPDNCSLSTEAIERIAVCILLLEPPLNAHPDFEADCEKKKGGFRGVIANMSDENIEDMRKDFRKVFGTFGYHLTHSIESLDELNELNVFYFNKFTNVNGKLK